MKPRMYLYIKFFKSNKPFGLSLKFGNHNEVLVVFLFIGVSLNLIVYLSNKTDEAVF